MAENWTWPPSYDDTYRPDAAATYWFPERETMDPEQRDELVLGRIQKLMAYAYETSVFYREKWSSADLHPRDIRSLEDFEQVPPVRKEELRLEQELHPPFGRYLCIPEGEVHHVHGTSGTTGRPTAFGIGSRDWSTIASCHARVMWGMGIRPEDTVFIGSFFSLYLGSWGATIGAERLGASVFPFGAGAPGQTRRAVSWCQQMLPTVFYGTPSYALHLAETARQEGVDPTTLGLRRMFFSGEPGASIPSVRRVIEESFDAAVFDSGSMAEITPWMHLAETSESGCMLVWQDIAYTEVVNPSTHRRVPYGNEGTPVYTTLERTSQPMIRLLSNDLTMWDTPGSSCGRTYPRLPHGVYGRIDDMLTIRGENVYPSAIQDVVGGFAEYGGEHRIYVTRDVAMDEMAVSVEIRPDVAPSRAEETRQQMESALASALGVRATVTLVPHQTFDRTQLKASRVIDRRGLTQDATAGHLA